MIKQPDILITEKEKTSEWVEKNIKYFSSISNTNNNINNDILYWGYYNNRINHNDTTYLTQIGDSVLPAKVRRTPKQRQFINTLVSQQYKRPFVFSVVLSDRESVKEKYLSNVVDYIDYLDKQAQFVHYETTFQIQETQDKISRMQQMVQQEPKTEEEAQQLQEIKQSLPRIINNFQYAMSMLEQQDAISQTQMQKMNYYHKYEKKDWKEIIAQNTLLNLRQELDVSNKSLENFIINRVIGRQYYYVDYVEGNRLPLFEVLNPSNVKYPFISSVKWVQDGPWGTITDYLSYNEVIILYGKQIEKKYGNEVLNTLRSSESNYRTPMVTGKDGEAYFTDNLIFDGNNETAYGIKVERVWFKVPRNIKVKYIPSPFEDGVYFRHFIQNKEIINKDEYIYSNGFFINKKNKLDIKDENDVETISKKKGEAYIDKYNNDLYHGVIINDKYIVNEGKCPFVLRDIDRRAKIFIPIFGKTYASITDQPYSHIAATKDLQDLYDIVTYQEELMLALSGTKTILFDLAFKPPEMTEEEWERQKKMGMLNIRTTDEMGRQTAGIFNQWTMFDLSVSNSIGLLANIKNNIEQTMGDVMGVPPAMKGQMTNTDQVGTYNASIKQALLINEILFAEHDEIEGKALTHCLNLALNYCYKNGATFGFNNTDLSGEIVNIPENILNKVRFNVLLANNTEEAQGIEDIKQFMASGKSGIQFGDITELWGIKSLTELRERAKYLSMRAVELMSSQAANAEQAQVEKEKLKIQLNNELLAPWKAEELKIQQMAIDVKKALGEINAQVLDRKNSILEKQIENENIAKHTKIASEKQIEDIDIAVKDKHASTNEQLKMLEIQVNKLMAQAKLDKDDIISQRDYGNKMAKVMVENNKQKIEKSNINQ
jgi:hypothetical protein